VAAQVRPSNIVENYKRHENEVQGTPISADTIDGAIHTGKGAVS